MSITVEAGFKHIADSAYAMLSRDEKLRGLTITAHQCLKHSTVITRYSELSCRFVFL